MVDETGFSEKKGDGAQAPEDGELTLAQDMFQSFRSVVWIVVSIILLFTFVVRVTVVDGHSMDHTLAHGDIVLVRSIGYRPRAGDIVVLTKTAFRPQSIIKRVIAVEGQTVDIDYSTGSVYVDGEVREEPWLWEPMRAPWWGGPTHVTVPEGHIFVMGDNRNDSSDSRWPEIGMVDTRCVIGRAMLVAFPFSDFKLL